MKLLRQRSRVVGYSATARVDSGAAFIRGLLTLEKQERFNHIDDHFMGRHRLTTQGIQDWMPVDNNIPKGELLGSPLDLSPLPGQDRQDSRSDQWTSRSSTGDLPEVSEVARVSDGGEPHFSIWLVLIM